MGGLTVQLNHWAAHWAPWLVGAIWQSTVLAMVIWLVSFLLRRAAPSVRYWLWQIVAMKLLVAPFWTFTLPWSPPVLPWLLEKKSVALAAAELTPAEPVGSPWNDRLPAVGAASSDALVSKSLENQPATSAGVERMGWPAALMVLWITIVVGNLAFLAWLRIRLARSLSNGAPASEELNSLTHQWRKRIGLRRDPRVVVVEESCSPFVCGIFQPTLVVPRRLESMASSGKLDPIVAHELAHLRRWDLLWNWIPHLATTIFFFHPVAYWAAYRIRLESELACDAQAMMLSGRSSGAYANVLVDVLSRLAESEGHRQMPTGANFKSTTAVVTVEASSHDS